MASNPKSTAPAPALPSSGVRRRIARVLIIDDEADHAAILRHALAQDYEVVAVTDAEVALARLSAGERFDLVLSDLMMPSMDGVEFHRRLAATLPQTAERVVFMSGGARVVRIESFIRRVPNLFLTKPLNLDGLRALVERRVLGDVAREATP